MANKICSCCKVSKNITEFGRHLIKKDGLRCYCKDCSKTKSKKWNAKYYATNKDNVLKLNKLWKEVAEKSKLQEYRNKWKEKNISKIRADGMKRYARKTNQTPGWLSNSHHAEIEGLYFFCQVFNSYKINRTDKFQVDHIVPIRGKQVSGLHVPWNLQAITGRENMQKSCKFNPSVYHQQGRCAFTKEEN